MLSKDLKALAQGILDQHRTGFSISFHKMMEMAEKAEELEGQLNVAGFGQDVREADPVSGSPDKGL